MPGYLSDFARFVATTTNNDATKQTIVKRVSAWSELLDELLDEFIDELFEL